MIAYLIHIFYTFVITTVLCSLALMAYVRWIEKK